MLKDSHAFSGFSVKDLEATKKFYGETLGLDTDSDGMGLHLHLAGNVDVFIYQKDDHIPATFTILNFPVDDVEQTVAELKGKGITFEQYEGLTDDDGIAHGIAQKRGPDIAWFKDPSGNILSVLHDE